MIIIRSKALLVLLGPSKTTHYINLSSQRYDIIQGFSHQRDFIKALITTRHKTFQDLCSFLNQSLRHRIRKNLSRQTFIPQQYSMDILASLHYFLALKEPLFRGILYKGHVIITVSRSFGYDGSAPISPTFSCERHCQVCRKLYGVLSLQNSHVLAWRAAYFETLQPFLEEFLLELAKILHSTKRKEK